MCARAIGSPPEVGHWHYRGQSGGNLPHQGVSVLHGDVARWKDHIYVGKNMISPGVLRCLDWKSGVTAWSAPPPSPLSLDRGRPTLSELHRRDNCPREA